MADLATLKSRIASELNRSDLTTQIASAISTAITYHRSRRFEVNELQATFSTTNGTQVYTTSTIPADIGQFDVVRITVGGTTYPLRPLSVAELLELTSTTTARGAPTRFAVYAQQLYLYPIPDATYTVQVSYQQRKAAPSADGDGTTIWTNACEPLIRACAKKLICRDVTHDPEGFQSNEAAETEALNVLLFESTQLQDDGSPLAGSD